MEAQPIRTAGRRSTAPAMTEFGYAILQLGVLGLVLGSLEWCFPNRPEQRRLRAAALVGDRRA